MLTCASVQPWGEERQVVIDDVLQVFGAVFNLSDVRVVAAELVQHFGWRDSVTKIFMWLMRCKSYYGKGQA